MTADFEKRSVVVELTDFAEFKGSIDNNKFSGSRASMREGDHKLSTKDNKFTGSFEGAFFGSIAKEAGGVFDYKSVGNKEGAFRGAFGGVRNKLRHLAWTGRGAPDPRSGAPSFCATQCTRHPCVGTEVCSPQCCWC